MILFKIFLYILILFSATTFSLSPCKPSPCGFNAICKEQHGVGSCSCLQDYIGNPYDGCRPECVVDTDCISTLACIQSKCKDPCPGVCGQFAECQVINHQPSCTCIAGYSGNPFHYCNIIRDIGINTSLNIDILSFIYFNFFYVLVISSSNFLFRTCCLSSKVYIIYLNIIFELLFCFCKFNSLKIKYLTYMYKLDSHTFMNRYFLDNLF